MGLCLRCVVAPYIPVVSLSPILRVVHGRREVSALSMVSRPFISRGLAFVLVGCVNLLWEGLGYRKLVERCQKGPCACTYEVVQYACIDNKGGHKSQDKLGSLVRCCLVDCFVWLKLGCPVKVSKVGCA